MERSCAQMELFQNSHKKRLKMYKIKDNQVVIATGRPYRMAIDHYKTLGLETPLITFNGSLTNLPDQNWAYEHSVKLDKKYLINLLQRHDELEMDFLASEYRKHFYISMNHPERIQPQLFGVDKIIELCVWNQQKLHATQMLFLCKLVTKISTS